jgi:hypothetical protein
LISLTSIQNFVLDIVQGRSTDSSLYSSQVFSESWGSYERLGEAEARVAEKYHFRGRRICVFTDKGKVTYNLSSEKVEEALVDEGSDAQTVAKMAEKCVKFAALNDKLLAFTNRAGAPGDRPEAAVLRG